MAQKKDKYLHKLKPHFEYVSESWEEFFLFAEEVGTIAELGFIWITSPFWIIPYLIYKKHKGG